MQASTDAPLPASPRVDPSQLGLTPSAVNTIEAQAAASARRRGADAERLVAERQTAVQDAAATVADHNRALAQDRARKLSEAKLDASARRNAARDASEVKAADDMQKVLTDAERILADVSLTGPASTGKSATDLKKMLDDVDGLLNEAIQTKPSASQVMSDSKVVNQVKARRYRADAQEKVAEADKLMAEAQTMADPAAAKKQKQYANVIRSDADGLLRQADQLEPRSTSTSRAAPEPDAVTPAQAKLIDEQSRLVPEIEALLREPSRTAPTSQQANDAMKLLADHNRLTSQVEYTAQRFNRPVQEVLGQELRAQKHGVVDAQRLAESAARRRSPTAAAPSDAEVLASWQELGKGRNQPSGPAEEIFKPGRDAPVEPRTELSTKQMGTASQQPLPHEGYYDFYDTPYGRSRSREVSDAERHAAEAALTDAQARAANTEILSRMSGADEWNPPPSYTYTERMANKAGGPPKLDPSAPSGPGAGGDIMSQADSIIAEARTRLDPAPSGSTATMQLSSVTDQDVDKVFDVMASMREKNLADDALQLARQHLDDLSRAEREASPTALTEARQTVDAAQRSLDETAQTVTDANTRLDSSLRSGLWTPSVPVSSVALHDVSVDAGVAPWVSAPAAGNAPAAGSRAVPSLDPAVAADPAHSFQLEDISYVDPAPVAAAKPDPDPAHSFQLSLSQKWALRIGGSDRGQRVR